MAVFVVVNLFIAVVINNLESVKHEQQVETDRASAHGGLLEAIEDGATTARGAGGTAPRA